MPWIPLKNIVKVTPFLGNDPDYNEPIFGEPYEVKCRVNEGAKIIRNKHGQEVVSSVQLFFDKLSSINVSDKIEFTDENGVTTAYRPISKEAKRWLNGKAILTVVNCE